MAPKLEEWQKDHLTKVVETSPLTFDEITLAIATRERQKHEEANEQRILDGQLPLVAVAPI